MNDRHQRTSRYDPECWQGTAECSASGIGAVAARHMENQMPRSSLRTSPARKQTGAAMPKLSTNRRSGDGWGARLERRTSRRNHGDDDDVVRMLDGVNNDRQRQLRRRGDERIAQQRDGGADR